MSQSQAIEARISNVVDDGTAEVDMAAVVCAAVDAAFPRTRCSCDECPNEPAWSRELTDLTETLITDSDQLVGAMLDKLRARLTEALATFAKPHPETAA
jgi:hypothetical protein